jgi:hypothetical protein
MEEAFEVLASCYIQLPYGSVGWLIIATVDIVVFEDFACNSKLLDAFVVDDELWLSFTVLSSGSFSVCKSS